MDYRCNKDFTSPKTIIYGHHMKNESMFGTLKLFNGKSFFDENKYGFVYLSRDTLTLEFFAYMVVNPNDQEIYSAGLSGTYFDYVKQNARNYRDVGLTEADRIVTLSGQRWKPSPSTPLIISGSNSVMAAKSKWIPDRADIAFYNICYSDKRL